MFHKSVEVSLYFTLLYLLYTYTTCNFYQKHIASVFRHKLVTIYIHFSLHNRRYFFALFRRAKKRANRARAPYTSEVGRRFPLSRVSFLYKLDFSYASQHTFSKVI